MANKPRRVAIRKHRAKAQKWKEHSKLSTPVSQPRAMAAPSRAVEPAPPSAPAEVKPAPRRTTRRARPAAAGEPAAAPGGMEGA